MIKSIVSALVLCVAVSAYSQSSFTLYGAKFKASEILGGGTFGVSGTDAQTPYLGNSKVTNDMYDILGQYYFAGKYSSTYNLLNKYSSLAQPVLDEINLRFYRENGFEELAKRNPGLANSDSLQKFEALFDSLYDSNKLVDARKQLYSRENRRFRLALEQMRYAPPAPDKTFTLSKTQQSGLAIGVSADIIALIGKKVQLDSKLRATLQDSIRRHVEFKAARYVEIGLHKEYISIASLIIKKYNAKANRAQLDAMTDVFSDDLRTFLDSTDCAIITGANVLCIAVNYEKYNKMVASIGATLKAKTNLEPTNLLTVNADINAMFNTTTGREFAMTNGITYYNLRYGYHNKLEIGNIKR